MTVPVVVGTPVTFARIRRQVPKTRPNNAIALPKTPSAPMAPKSRSRYFRDTQKSQPRMSLGGKDHRIRPILTPDTSLT